MLHVTLLAIIGIWYSNSFKQEIVNVGLMSNNVWYNAFDKNQLRLIYVSVMHVSN